MKPGAVQQKSRTAEVMAAIRLLAKNEVLIGVPKETAPRTEKDENGNTIQQPVNSAQLLYIHEHGSPARNIPARPSLYPGVASIRDEAAARLRAGAIRVLRGDAGAASRTLHAVGLLGQSAVRKKIVSKIPPPLSDATLQRRAARKRGTGVRVGKGAVKELASRAAGNLPGMEFTTPLIDTGLMLKAITYAIRERK